MNSFNFSSIGFISSCYKEKFGIPRQPNLVKSATTELHLNKQFGEESVRGLEGFSHLWIHFVFHKTLQQGWHSMVRPPRLGGNAKIGVFASRSPFRPNALGLSVVELLSIEQQQSGIVLQLGGCDLLDKTPVLDIKPYLPYVDALPDATGGFANGLPGARMHVTFTEQAKQQCKQAEARLNQNITAVITEILCLDPRPSYQQDKISERVYAMKLYDFDLRWQYSENDTITVLGLRIK